MTRNLQWKVSAKSIIITRSLADQEMEITLTHERQAQQLSHPLLEAACERVQLHYKIKQPPVGPSQLLSLKDFNECSLFHHQRQRNSLPFFRC